MKLLMILPFLLLPIVLLGSDRTALRIQPLHGGAQIKPSSGGIRGTSGSKRAILKEGDSLLPLDNEYGNQKRQDGPQLVCRADRPQVLDSVAEYGPSTMLTHTPEAHDALKVLKHATIGIGYSQCDPNHPVAELRQGSQSQNPSC